MAVNPTYGPIIQKSNSDPNGTPGQTSGGVRADVPAREVGEPTAGATASIPPFFTSPKRNPLEESFGPPADPGV